MITITIPLGLTINWAKTKIQTTDTTVSPGTYTRWWKQCTWRL